MDGRHNRQELPQLRADRALYPEGDCEVLEGWKGLRLDQGPTVKAKGAVRPTE